MMRRTLTLVVWDDDDGVIRTIIQTDENRGGQTN